jgi:CRISPR-associated protein Csm2
MGYNDKQNWNHSRSNRNYDKQDKIKNIENVPNWIKTGIEKGAIIFAEEVGKYLAENKLTTSQIRKIFGEVKKMEMKGYEEKKFLMLKPYLSYTAKRNSSRGMDLFKNIIINSIDAVVNNNDPNKAFNNFCQLFEAILAYHKSYGGK